jgi:hypothetical protein
MNKILSTHHFPIVSSVETFFMDIPLIGGAPLPMHDTPLPTDCCGNKRLQLAVKQKSR